MEAPICKPLSPISNVLRVLVKPRTNGRVSPLSACSPLRVPLLCPIAKFQPKDLSLGYLSVGISGSPSKGATIAGAAAAATTRTPQGSAEVGHASQTQ